MSAPQPPVPYSNPAPVAPVLAPSPLALGDVFAGVIGVFKRHWGLFVGIALLPALVSALAMVIFGVVVFVVVSAAIARGAQAPQALLASLAVPLALSTLGLIVAMFFVVLYQYKCYGMIALGTTDTASGRLPTFGDLNRRTRGLSMRVLGVALAIGAAVVAAYGVAGGIAVALFLPQGTSGGGSGFKATQVWVALLVIAGLAAFVGFIYISTRWSYFVPTLAVEGRGGFAALGRSWQLTRGRFWHTFGSFFVAGIAVAIPAFVVSLLSMPFADVDGTASLQSAIPRLLLALATLVVSVFTAPLFEIFRAIMYLDEVNRLHGVPAATQAPQPWTPPTQDPATQQLPSQTPWNPPASDPWARPGDNPQGPPRV